MADAAAPAGLPPAPAQDSRAGRARTELWNGNREQLRNLLSRDPMQSIVLYSFLNHKGSVERYTRRLADPAHAHLDVVRLRSPAEVRRFTDQLARPAT